MKPAAPAEANEMAASSLPPNGSDEAATWSFLGCYGVLSVVSSSTKVTSMLT
jgi:hypothetical protein